MIIWLEKHKNISLILTLLIAVEIFFFSSIPGGKTGGGIPYISIIYHFSVFFLFNFFLLTTLSRNNLKTKKLFTALSISTVYAILDELHQLYVPMRNASPIDFIIDFIGIIAATIIFIWTKQKIKQKLAYSSENHSSSSESNENEHD